MNNVITIEKVNSIYTDVCLSSQADGANAITVEIYPNNASNPQLKIYLNGTLETTTNLTNNAWNNVAISSSLFVANGVITFGYVDGIFSSDTFTITFPESLNGNLMLSKTTGFTFEAKYTVEETYSDTQVTQNNSTSDADYRLLLSKSANDTTETDEVNKNTNFRYNPSKKAVTIGTRKDNTTIGSNSIAFGSNAEASGNYSYSEGYYPTSTGEASHAEGYYTSAEANSAHSENYYTKASGRYSHAEGNHTTAQRQSQHVFGEFNILDTTGSSSTRGDFVEIVGNGTANNARSNARTLDWDGNEVLKGNLTTTDIKKPSGSTWDGTNASLSTAFKAVFDALLNADTNIVKWTKVTTFSQFDVYLYKFGIVKFLWVDTAKNNISSGWQSGGVGNLPSGYGALLDPVMTENKTLRNGVQMTITVNSSGNLNINPTASIASGTQIRIVFIYI